MMGCFEATCSVVRAVNLAGSTNGARYHAAAAPAGAPTRTKVRASSQRRRSAWTSASASGDDDSAGGGPATPFASSVRAPVLRAARSPLTTVPGVDSRRASVDAGPLMSGDTTDPPAAHAAYGTTTNTCGLLAAGG